jgi:ABC-2 type transport system permease protein
MELRLTARRGESVLVTAIVPAVVLIFFAWVDVLPVSFGQPVDFLLPGSLALAVVATSLVSLGIATAYERSYGVLKRLGGSPLTRVNLMTAKIAAVLVVELLQAGLLIAIASLLLGWSPGPSASPALLVAVIAVGTVAFAGLGLLFAGTLRAEATLALTNALFLATILLGGIIVPLDRLPGLLTAIGALLPGSALAEGFRIALGEGGDALRPLAVLTTWGIVAAAAGARTFRWE